MAARKPILPEEILDEIFTYVHLPLSQVLSVKGADPSYEYEERQSKDVTDVLRTLSAIHRSSKTFYRISEPHLYSTFVGREPQRFVFAIALSQVRRHNVKMAWLAGHRPVFNNCASCGRFYSCSEHPDYRRHVSQSMPVLAYRRSKNEKALNHRRTKLMAVLVKVIRNALFDQRYADSMVQRLLHEPTEELWQIIIILLCPRLEILNIRCCNWFRSSPLERILELVAIRAARLYRQDQLAQDQQAFRHLKEVTLRHFYDCFSEVQVVLPWSLDSKPLKTCAQYPPALGSDGLHRLQPPDAPNYFRPCLPYTVVQDHDSDPQSIYLEISPSDAGPYLLVHRLKHSPNLRSLKLTRRDAHGCRTGIARIELSVPLPHNLVTETA